MARNSLEHEIRSTQWLQAIRRAQAALDDIEMDEGVRKTIARCLNAEFSEALERFEDQTMRENDGKKWTPEEDALIRDYLSDKPRPPSWKDNFEQHYTQRRVLTLELAAQVKRSEKSVEKRAIALGFQHLE